MTTQDTPTPEIKLPPMPDLLREVATWVRITVPPGTTSKGYWEHRLLAAAVELDRQSRGTPTLPSDDEILNLWSEMIGKHHLSPRARLPAFARALLARYGAPVATPLPRRTYGTATMSEYGIIPECDTATPQPPTSAQPAASAEPVAWFRPDLLVDGKIQASSFTAHTNYREGYVPLSLAATVAAQPHNLRRAVEAYQIAEQACAQRHADAGDLIEPGIAVEAGLLAAAPFLAAQPSVLQTCETCNGSGIVGNILNAEPCPDCTPPADDPGYSMIQAAQRAPADGQPSLPEGWTWVAPGLAKPPAGFIADAQAADEPAQQDADRVDAERYRVMKSAFRGPGVTTDKGEDLWDLLLETSPELWDALIDAARVQQGGQS